VSCKQENGKSKKIKIFKKQKYKKKVKVSSWSDRVGAGHESRDQIQRMLQLMFVE